VPDDLQRLLDEFDEIGPRQELWTEAARRAELQPARRRRRRVPRRVVDGLIAAAVIVAALAGLIVGSRLHANQEGTGGPIQPPTSRVGADAWLGVLVSDVEARLPLSRALVRSGQCFTPQWQYLSTPVFIDLSAYHRIARQADPRVEIGDRFTSLNNRCNVFARQGGFSSQERTAILDRITAVERLIHNQPGGTAMLGVPPVIRGRATDPRVALLLRDLDTRISIARRLIEHDQCGVEVQKIAAPIQSDINLVLLYAAPKTHTIAEGMRHQPLVTTGADFMRALGPCFRAQKRGTLDAAQQTELTGQLDLLDRRIQRAVAP